MSVLTKTRGWGLGGRILVKGFVSNHNNHHNNLAFSRVVRTQSMLFSSAATETSTTSSNRNRNSERLFPEEINVLYDSKCNVCKLEMDWLVSRDIRLNGPDNRKLKLTDLEDDNHPFDPTDPCNGGINYAKGMAAIYAIKHDGSVYKGVPVFEMAYDQVGLGWIWKINQIPAANRFLEWGYNIFAKNRTRITRRASLEELLALNAAKKKAEEEDDCEACNIIQSSKAS